MGRALRLGYAGGMQIAVLSAACRLPGADSPAQLFTRLVARADAVGVVPADRWDHGTGSILPAPRHDAVPLRRSWPIQQGFDGGLRHRRGGGAGDVSPQQRLLLLAREALAAAGIAEVAGRRVGVFIGATFYATHGRRVQPFEAGEPIPGSAIISNLDNMLAARLSHALDLHLGQRLAVDSACSSTLVALLARQALETGECELALVEGAHLLVTPTLHLMMGAGGGAVAHRPVPAFAADADGIVLGRVGVLVLALEARPGRGLVAGGAAGGDGGEQRWPQPEPHAGAAPRGQAEVMAAAWHAGRDPRELGYQGAWHRRRWAIRWRPRRWPSLRQQPPTVAGGREGQPGAPAGRRGRAGTIKVFGMLQHGVVPPTLHGPARAALGLADAGLHLTDAATPWEGPRVYHQRLRLWWHQRPRHPGGGSRRPGRRSVNVDGLQLQLRPGGRAGGPTCRRTPSCGGACRRRWGASPTRPMWGPRIRCWPSTPWPGRRCCRAP
ncbi:MAG: beta-ketoacyl synthase N-terminal-like domain-containing protein [bacterium]